MKNSLIILTAIFLLLAAAIQAQGATYWSSPAGKASWSACRSETPLDGDAACPLLTASRNVTAGDTVYLRGGIYTYIYTSLNASIVPGYNSVSTIPKYNSGTKEKPITFSNYNGENVILDGNNVQWSTGLKIAGVDHIKIHGITFKNYEYIFELNGANYIEISHCVFDSLTLIPKIQHNSTHNRIHDSAFSRGGNVSPACMANGGLLDIGDRSGAWDALDFSSYNLIENNVFYYGSHYTIVVQAPFNVIRNNYFHNEEWMDCSQCGIPSGMCGNRVVADFGKLAYRNLYEGNSICFSGIASDYKQGGEGLELAGNHSIARFNRVYKNKGAGIYLYDKGLGGDPPGNNYIYFNTVYHNGYDGFGLVNFGGIQFSNSLGNVIKNNIVYDNLAGPFSGKPRESQSYEHNWVDSMGDPLFVNPDIGDPFNPGLPDLRVHPNSPVVNAGGWLTTITSPSGSGTTFAVADANYFMDGWGIIDGDIIQLEGRAQRAKITSIDYNANIITVDTVLSWSAGQGVSLAYNGPAPDIGAYEYAPAPGDISGDGTVTAYDAALALQLGKTELEAGQITQQAVGL